jgi:hypothetical protein
MNKVKIEIHPNVEAELRKMRVWTKFSKNVSRDWKSDGVFTTDEQRTSVVIQCAFSWALSPEGFSFWRTMHTLCQKLETAKTE